MYSSLTLLSFSPSLWGMSVLSDWKPELILCIRLRSLLLAISRRMRRSWSRAVSGVRGMFAKLQPHRVTALHTTPRHTFYISVINIRETENLRCHFLLKKNRIVTAADVQCIMIFWGQLNCKRQNLYTDSIVVETCMLCPTWFLAWKTEDKSNRVPKSVVTE